jgi:hypothetical protein
VSTRHWTIRRATQSWLFHEWNSCGEREGVLRFASAESARGWLRQFKSDSLAMPAIRGMVAANSSDRLRRMTDDEVLRQFGWLLRQGKIHVHGTEVKTVGTHGGRPVAPPQHPPPPPLPHPPTPRPPPPAVVKCLTSITASVSGTNGKRKATDKRPKNHLTASNSDQESLTTNAPVVLVRGCHMVHLKAVTTPANEPVTWVVKANQNTGTAPTLTPTDGGRSATLTTDKTGSFSVIGTLQACKRVWNVVFVWVNVDVSTATVTKNSTFFADAGSTATSSSFKSGDFPSAKYAWQGKVKLKMVGGGSDSKMGIDKVKVQILQNGILDTLSGNYDGPTKWTEVPKGGVPVLDATDVSSPFITNPIAGKVTPTTGVDREWWSGDSPAGGFPTTYKTTPKALKTISGVNKFVTAVASVSDDAANSIVVHAKATWTADFSGSFAGGVYVKTTAAVSGDATFALISDSTGGQDAQDANIETFPPVFNDGTDLV